MFEMIRHRMKSRQSLHSAAAKLLQARGALSLWPRFLLKLFPIYLLLLGFSCMLLGRGKWEAVEAGEVMVSRTRLSFADLF